MTKVIDLLNTNRHVLVEELPDQCAQPMSMGTFDALHPCGIWQIGTIGAPIEYLEMINGQYIG